MPGLPIRLSQTFSTMFLHHLHSSKMIFNSIPSFFLGGSIGETHISLLSTAIPQVGGVLAMVERLVFPTGFSEVEDHKGSKSVWTGRPSCAPERPEKPNTWLSLTMGFGKLGLDGSKAGFGLGGCFLLFLFFFFFFFLLLPVVSFLDL